MLKQLCSQETKRTAARNHLAQHLPGMEPQFGMYLDIQRVNCEYCKCGDGIWLKTVRDVSAGEELLMCYSQDGSYWAAIFSKEQLSQITAALNSCGPSLQDAERCIRLHQV
ncbi:hypothetical protein P5673_026584 [Acropora cervicornis]|uniref:SET domain-containing protein n=1 Tax=Acropora cervicornis TaxID=6130 RepID=A0AAD9Q0H2_ACRCE|nr:hypothetical protein P5673_026584 [Acropora cervicornis]